jgi:hypothetical protein
MSIDGFHLFIDASRQDGSYAFTYNKNWAWADLYAVTYMFGGTEHDGPKIFFQILGDGNSADDVTKQLKAPM